jgi:predicted NBD/HSP70 family sugar kinase
VADSDSAGAPAGPQMIRAMNEQLVLVHLRRAGKLSRAELTRLTGLSKPTISLTITNLERSGMVGPSGRRTGTAGPAATLYQIRPEAGYVMGLDVGSQFLRGAVCDLSGAKRSRLEIAVDGTQGEVGVKELSGLAAKLRAEAGISAAELTQTVLGTPGVYDPRRDTLTLTGSQPDWEKPELVGRLRSSLGATLMIENDVDAAAMAEREYGHGRNCDSFAFVSVGTGIGMGLVLDGRLRRGSHGAAGEIGYLPIDGDTARRRPDARRRGRFESEAAAAGIVRAARRAGLRRVDSARAVFAAAAAGDPRAVAVLADEADLIARGLASIIAVVDPQLVVLGGGIGQADGFLDLVARALPRFAPVIPELRVSALGADAVVDGCLAAGLDRAWTILAPGPRNNSSPENGFGG